MAPSTVPKTTIAIYGPSHSQCPGSLLQYSRHQVMDEVGIADALRLAHRMGINGLNRGWISTV